MSDQSGNGVFQGTFSFVFFQTFLTPSAKDDAVFLHQSETVFHLSDIYDSTSSANSLALWTKELYAFDILSFGYN